MLHLSLKDLDSALRSFEEQGTFESDVGGPPLLKQAFSGELVPQDPDDEPASVLLARIGEERRAAEQKAGRPRKAKKDDEAQGRLL